MIVTDREILSKISEPCLDGEEIQIVNKLREEVRSHPNAVGLSAIQIGIPKRVFIVKRDNAWIHFVNPIILKKSEYLIETVEGCLSFPDVVVNAKRYDPITVSDDHNGEQVLSNFDSVVFQHELDHLDGVTFFDRGRVIRDGSTVVSDSIGRNKPCNCGSGKKYKKCCGK